LQFRTDLKDPPQLLMDFTGSRGGSIHASQKYNRGEIFSADC